ncbi:hypothetical protein MAHJHV57_54670 [Mycobacterium avium subsp. hominissuis]
MKAPALGTVGATGGHTPGSADRPQRRRLHRGNASRRRAARPPTTGGVPAGLRDDGTTTLLVTDLASGWIPPHVRLPAHVTLLEPSGPADRR